MAIHELPAVQESLVDRITSYLPDPEVLRDYPNARILERETREEARGEIPGSDYALVTSRRGGRIVMVPYHHPENSLPPEAPGPHYSHVAFEGISLMPVVDDNGQIVSANLILFRERMKRFRRSIRALGAGIPDEAAMAKFEQGIIDLASVEGESVLRDRNRNPSRAYVRSAYLRLGTFGVAPKDEAPYHLSDFEWNWPLYISQEAYDRGGIATVFLDAQRKNEVRGKLAGNYVDAGVHAKRARELEGNEVLYLGPYIIKEHGFRGYINYQQGLGATSNLLKSGTLVDGSGEDVIFEGRDGTIYYQPKDTNILAGTTREYIITRMADRLGLAVAERAVTLSDVRKKEIVGMSYVGNAVKVLGVRKIGVYDTWKPESQLLDSLELELTPGLQKIQTQFEGEISGVIPASHQSLLTPVDLEFGRIARQKLDSEFAGWF